MKSYLLNSIAHFEAPNDQGAAAEVARKAAIAVERAKVVVTKVDIKDDEEEKNNEQEKEDGEEEIKTEGNEDDDEKSDDEKFEDEDKEVLKAKKKDERVQRRIDKEVSKRKELETKIVMLEAKLTANPDRALTEADVETLAEKKAQEKELQAQQTRLINELNEKANDLADKSQKHLKLKSGQFNALVKEALEELNIEAVPGELVGALHDLDNGGIVLAHLLKNVDEMEDLIALRNRPTKLGMELTKLATKLAMPAKKKISQVPDSVEPLGGKAVQSDRLAFLMNKKGKTQEEMSEYVLLRNADVSNKKANGRHGLR